MDDQIMTQITTIAQARQALTEIEGLLEHLENSLGSALGPIKVRSDPRVELSSPVSRPSQIQAPKSFNERILTIIRDSGGSMMPKDVVSKYQSLNWPLPKGDTYKRIMNAIFYLKGKGKLVRTETGYAIA
ncbi:MAG: hypothetical protein WAK51_15440 [Opitutaceae bacterium]